MRVRNTSNKWPFADAGNVAIFRTAQILRLGLPILGAFLFALIFAGCAGKPQQQSAHLPDRYYVAEAALHYMLDKHSGFGVERDVYSAYILEPGEFTSQLLASFPEITRPLSPRTFRSQPRAEKHVIGQLASR